MAEERLSFQTEVGKILQIVANAGHVGDDIDAEITQMLCRPDAG